MADITLIFPDQLFLDHPGLHSKRPIYLVEEFLFFKAQPFHKQRLVLLRSAMRSYAKMLTKKQRQVTYISSKELNCRGDLFDLLGKKEIKNIYMAEFADEWLQLDLNKGTKKYGWKTHFEPSPGFLYSNQELKDFFLEKKHYSMAQFYSYQRKAQDILMQGKSPIGGKYSFDAENRKKIPKKVAIPASFLPPKNLETTKIIKEIESEFPDAIGEASPFLYPITHSQAKQALQLFLTEKIFFFGDYQDGIKQDNSFLFHSVLSSSLNTGLLTPNEVIQTAISYSEKNFVPINCLEGFLRQIMGWREFVRASYLLKGSFQRSFNFFQHQDKIPKSFWEGTTGIVPIDITVKRALKTGYCNHIERLMVLGNFLLLTEISPQEIYKWFMGYFIDAYDWVMVPNIYGMSQYADGGIMITKPYISSSNYLLKMSDYPKGAWVEIWDGLFWRFFQKHLPLFSSNYRTLSLTKILKKNELTISKKIEKANLWLKDYKAQKTY